MEKNEKKWIKVPWTTIALQAGLLVFCGIFVQFQFDIMCSACRWSRFW